MSNNNPNNIRLSACRVRWGGRDLGMTKGGVDVTIKTDTKQITVDQNGTAPINEYVLGRSVMVKAPFAETDLDNLYAMMKTSGNTLTDNGTVATGTYTLAAVPTANDTIVVNGHTFTWVSATPVLDQVLIGADAPTSIANLVKVLQQSTDPRVEAGVYVGAAGVLNISYFQSGTVGNSFTLAKTGTSGTASGATLTGGLAATTRTVNILSTLGNSLFATSVPLVLHPADLADNDTSQDFVVPLANTPGNLNFAYKIDNERIYTLDFMGYPDPVTRIICTYGNH